MTLFKVMSCSSKIHSKNTGCVKAQQLLFYLSSSFVCVSCETGHSHELTDSTYSITKPPVKGLELVHLLSCSACQHIKNRPKRDLCVNPDGIF